MKVILENGVAVEVELCVKDNVIIGIIINSNVDDLTICDVLESFNIDLNKLKFIRQI